MVKIWVDYGSITRICREYGIVKSSRLALMYRVVNKFSVVGG